MSVLGRVSLLSLSALAGGLFSFGPLFAQTVEVGGIVVDAEGEPVPGLTVGLHRVGEEGGAPVGVGETDEAGRFLIPLNLPPDSAIYFATTRHEGMLHVGTPFRGPVAEAGEQLIALSAPPVAGTGAPGAVPGAAPGTPPGRAAAPPPGSGPGDWLPWLVLPALAATLLLVHWRRSRRSPDVRRALIVQLADLEESHAAAGDRLTSAATVRYERERAMLRSRIRVL